MSRAHLYRSISDSDGNIKSNVQVTVFNAGSTQLIQQVLYTSSDGNGVLPNPFVSSAGLLDFYLNKPQSVKVTLRADSSLSTIDNIEVTPAPENVVQAATGFAIQNTPIAGQFLQASDTKMASWVDAADLVTTKASPLNTLATYQFSTSDPGNLVITDTHAAAVTPTYVAVTGALPAGYTFTRALQVPTSLPVSLRIPALTFPEAGVLVFVYKVVSAASGIGGAILRVMMDGGERRIETATDPNLINSWVVGYLGGIPAGTHSLQIDHLPGSDTASYVLLGYVLVRYGGNIPYHTHQGKGDSSLVLGALATADFPRSSAAGGEAMALGDDATAFGYRANAQARAVALGPYSHAAPDGVSLGYYATSQDGTTGGVAVGRNAHTGADNAVAIGIDSSAPGARAVALGHAAHATADDSVALGPDSSASAVGSSAIGHGASVPSSTHLNSMAIGAGSVTTGANQVVLGTVDSTVVVPGALVASGASTVLGTTASTMGFYGHAANPRPVVQGSRGSNQVLGDLLTALDALGLISNQSSA